MKALTAAVAVIGLMFVVTDLWAHPGAHPHPHAMDVHADVGQPHAHPHLQETHDHTDGLQGRENAPGALVAPPCLSTWPVVPAGDMGAFLQSQGLDVVWAGAMGKSGHSDYLWAIHANKANWIITLTTFHDFSCVVAQGADHIPLFEAEPPAQTF